MRITPIELRNRSKAKKLMASLGVSRQGVRILAPKSIYLAFKIEGIKSWEANILKQHLLSEGSDAAIERRALLKDIKTQALIFGNLTQLKALCQKLKTQPFNLSKISEIVSSYLDNLDKKKFNFLARDKILTINKPIICGIINLTPDSFSGDGLLVQNFCFGSGFGRQAKFKIQNLALKRVEEMIKAGAKIIDLGGESSRPFSRPVKEAEEIKRVIPALRAIRRKFSNIIISVDTCKYKVAKAAVNEGVDVINDITALRGDLRKASLVKKYRLGCILMHMKAKPQTMQIRPVYKDVINEELDFFKERLEFCQRKGISKEQILIDPGIGFGKRLEDNLKLINELYKFKIFGLPIFLGLSRKSFIGKILKAEVQERLVGSIAASIFALNQGANILRTHDVAETFQAVRVISKIINN